jgi:hypothetical protein
MEWNYPALLIEIVCFLASITLFFQASMPLYLRTFPFFMIITIIIEVVSKLLMQNRVDVNLLFCLFTAFELEYYLYIISFSIRRKKVKKIIMWLLATYPVLVVVNLIFIQPGTFNTNTYALGCLLVVSACIYYFFEMFQSTHSVNLAKEPAFWICSGLLFFYTCTFPLIGLWNHLHGLPRVILTNLGTILTLLNFLLYSLFSIACLCRIRFRKVLGPYKNNKPSTP